MVGLPRGASSDRAIGFGYKTEWLAVRHDDVLAVIGALGLDGTRSASWPEGTWAINEGAIFVTPPMNGFVLVAGGILGLSVHDGLKRISERLSAELGTEVCAFISYRNVHLYRWARARRGIVERVYFEGENDTILSEGVEPAEEAALHADRLAGRAERGPQEVTVLTRDGSTTNVVVPHDEVDPHWADQYVVREIAAAWSVDPIAFDAWPEVVANGWVAEGLAKR